MKLRARTKVLKYIYKEEKSLLPIVNIKYSGNLGQKSRHHIWGMWSRLPLGLALGMSLSHGGLAHGPLSSCQGPHSP